MTKFNTMLATLLLLAGAQTATAGSWICENGTLVREITVQLETENAAPCSVVYDKSAEGQGTQVLWTARNDGGYCAMKADGLAEKLKGHGWSCTAF